MKVNKGQEAEVVSPCVRNCCLNAQDICVGCYRSLTEICEWRAATAEQKSAILQACEIRKLNHASISALRSSG